jgi:hypothetical protein
MERTSLEIEMGNKSTHELQNEQTLKLKMAAGTYLGLKKLSRRRLVKVHHTGPDSGHGGPNLHCRTVPGRPPTSGSALHHQDEDVGWMSHTAPPVEWTVVLLLICYYIVEWHLPARVVRQFSRLQTVVVQHAATSQSLHKYVSQENYLDLLSICGLFCEQDKSKEE